MDSVSGSRAPTAPETPGIVPGEWLLRFEVPGLALCLGLGSVEEVLLLAAPRVVPGAPPHVLGLLDLRGRPVPVIDLARWLGRAVGAGPSWDSPMLHCASGDRRVLLVVERVIGPHRLTREEAEATLAASGGPAFTGAVPAAGVVSMCLDLEAVLDAALLRAPRASAVVAPLAGTGAA